MKIYKDIEQGSEEWFKLRLGKLTASEFHIATAQGRKKGEPSVQTLPLIFKLLSEKWTGESVERYYNEAMEWGNEYEDMARAQYELRHPEIDLEQVGFIEYNDYIGGSPDGICKDGGVEIKCPTSHVQVKRVFDGSFPKDYTKQVYGYMWLTDAEWWDFVSFDPRLPKGINYFEIRVNRNEEIIKELTNGISVFIEKLLCVESQLQGDKDKLDYQLKKSIKKLEGIV